MLDSNNEKNIKFLKQKIIISMCAIVLLVLTIFGITYAYFSTKIQGNKEETSVEVSSATLKLDYYGENSYVEVKSLVPDETIESKKFSVKNTGTRIIHGYDVILENLVNELVRYEDLKYELTCISSDGKDCYGSEGVFPRTNQVIATNSIDVDVTHSYILKLTYKESNVNQSIDMDKEISAKVNIKDDYSNIKTFKVYGNYTIIESPVNSSVSIIEYLGDYNETNGKYNIPINISGNVVNLTLNEPLRKLDNIADYIDLENRIVVRMVGEKVLDGTENILNYENGVYFGIMHDYNIPAISNYYSNNINDAIHFTSTKNSNAIHFRVDENADEFKELIKERYDNNEPLKVLYALNGLVFEPISISAFKIDNTDTVTVCDKKDLCSSNIEVEFD